MKLLQFYLTTAISLLLLVVAAQGFLFPSASALRRPSFLLKMSSAKRALTQDDYRANLNDGAKIQAADVAVMPRPGTSSPSSIHFYADSDNDTWVTYLAPDEGGTAEALLTRKLWATKVVGGGGETIEVFQPTKEKEEYSLEEQLRRERARLMSTGVTSYQWAGEDTMLVPLGGALWILDGLGAEPHKLVETNTGDNSVLLPLNAPLLDAKLSSDGSTVAFVADNEVYTVKTDDDDASASSIPTQVTFGARGVDGMSNGVADYVAQEELERSHGFWLSPNGTKLAYEQVDESHIAHYRITHQGEPLKTMDMKATDSCEDVAKAAQVTYEQHRYPFAGAENPKVKLGVVDTSGTNSADKDTTTWFDLASVFDTDDFYLAKVEWLKEGDGDSTKLIVQLLDRRQQRLALVLCDASTGDMTILHVETALTGAWINLNDAFRVLDYDGDSMEFLWASERDGYRHLYVLKANTSNKTKMKEAQVVRRLTGPGEFIVEQVVEVNDDELYYMGTAPNQWLERHLFRISLDDDDESEPECLTSFAEGQHSCVVNLKSGLFCDTVSSVTQPPLVTIRKLSDPSTAVLQLHDAGKADARVAELGTSLQAPTFHQFPSTDGKVTLQAALYKPTSFGNDGPWPLVVATYGGPHVQYVSNSYAMMVADMRTQFLLANGFCVLKVDNRGSNRRGLAFESAIRCNMGDLEVQDQVAGVEWAVKEGVADADRVAVSGWSYGGYMALKCLTGRPDVFQAGISGAPVTDWTLYDTAYTERYMGLPQENPEGYTKASAMHNVKDLQGSLMLCHGLLDENVLFRHSAVLVNELIAHQKAYDLVLFPSERHGPRRPQDRAFLEERILAFLQRSLGV